MITFGQSGLFVKADRRQCIGKVLLTISVILFRCESPRIYLGSTSYKSKLFPGTSIGNILVGFLRHGVLDPSRAQCDLFPSTTGNFLVGVPCVEGHYTSRDTKALFACPRIIQNSFRYADTTCGPSDTSPPCAVSESNAQLIRPFR